ncbi:MAG: hypothetical protein WDO19_18325 [Bacteroidota bacterium]
MSKLYIFFGILSIIQIILARICGPHSCEWGNKTYFYAGILIAIAGFILPYFLTGWSAGKQTGLGFLFLLLSAVVWIAGFFIGNFKIICRLI